jgi:coronin-1B/1C/6
MSRFVRQSKVRHVYCQTPKPDNTYMDLRLSSATGDHNYIKGNNKFFAIPYGTRGVLAVIPHSKTGKLPTGYPMITGHKSSILDFDFNPFHDNIIATGSNDCHAMVWGIPSEDGLTENMNEPLVDLVGHERKVNLMKFHPTADHVLATAGADFVVKLWDVESQQEGNELQGHSQLIQSLAWNYDGSILATSSKDKILRLFDARQSAASSEWQAHDGSKTSKLCWLGNTGKLVSVGFTRQSKRQFKIWDPKNTEKPLATCDIDQAAGVIMPFFDEDINVLYLAGKGDGNIRYYEIVPEAPHYFQISEFRSSTSAKGCAILPKAGNNIMGCEVTRLLKLTSNSVEPLSFVLPRKSDLFQRDIFPDCRDYTAAPMSAAEYFGGKNANPNLCSLDPKKSGSGGGGGGAAKAKASFKPMKSSAQLQKELDAANARIAELEAKCKAAGVSI